MSSEYWWKRKQYKTPSPPKRQTSAKKQKQNSILTQKTVLDGISVRDMKKLRIELENYIQKIQQMISFYELLSQNMTNSKNQQMMTVRCYKHNNDIIFYCETDRQLLCPNCIYGQKPSTQNDSNHKHQKHQLIKIQNSHHNITRDIKQHAYQFKDHFTNNLRQERLWNDLSIKLQQTVNSLKKQLDNRYDFLLKSLSSSYLKIKENIEIKFKEFHQTMTSISECYKISKQYSQQRFPNIQILHCYYQAIQIFNKQMKIKFRQFSRMASYQDAQLNGTQMIQNFQKIFTKQIRKYGSTISL